VLSRLARLGFLGDGELDMLLLVCALRQIIHESLYRLLLAEKSIQMPPKANAARNYYQNEISPVLLKKVKALTEHGQYL